MPDDQSDYRLTLRPVGDSDTPPVLRLRAVLKRLLRDYGFRCTKTEELPGPDSAQNSSLSSSNPECSPTFSD